jgi:hypothetical protein
MLVKVNVSATVILEFIPGILTVTDPASTVTDARMSQW